MPTFTFRRVWLEKRYPLQISRGTSTGSENLFVLAEEGEHTGVGEASPGVGSEETTAASAEEQLRALIGHGIEGLSISEIWQAMRDRGLDPPAMAALDIALWDLFAKQCGQPLYRVFGLSNRCAPTSVTLGINPPEVVRERVPEILSRTGAKSLKIKLGSPQGIESDQESFEAARQAAAPFSVRLRVDANGGWSVEGARHMLRWLSERGVDYVEQPLPEGVEDRLPELYRERFLPIFVDESCRFAEDIPKLAGKVDGVNLKLMKCGGLTEALRIVAAARAHGLKTMIGCMSESSVAIAAGASIGALFDHIDLDAHLNLAEDPAEGLLFEKGVVRPREAPGHGAFLKGHQGQTANPP